jgi:hypothetical protein
MPEVASVLNDGGDEFLPVSVVGVDRVSAELLQQEAVLDRRQSFHDREGSGRPRRAKAGVPAERYDDAYLAEAYEVMAEAFLLSFGSKTGSGVPKSFREAKNSANWPAWEEAMDREIAVIGRSGTYMLVPREGQHVLPNMWVFTIKTDSAGVLLKYKARLVVLGNRQIAGLEFNLAAIYSPVVRTTSLRLFLAIAAFCCLTVYQLDIVGAFLHSKVKEEIYMRQPVGYEVPGKEGWVCRLRRSLYGLRQAPAEFNEDLHNQLTELGLVRTEFDPCVYVLSVGVCPWAPALLVVHVDDQCFAGSERCYEWLKEGLARRFTLDDRGVARQVVGLDVRQTAEGIYLSDSVHASVAGTCGDGVCKCCENPVGVQVGAEEGGSACGRGEGCAQPPAKVRSLGAGA